MTTSFRSISPVHGAVLASLALLLSSACSQDFDLESNSRSVAGNWSDSSSGTELSMDEDGNFAVNGDPGLLDFTRSQLGGTYETMQVAKRRITTTDERTYVGEVQDVIFTDEDFTLRSEYYATDSELVLNAMLPTWFPHEDGNIASAWTSWTVWTMTSPSGTVEYTSEVAFEYEPFEDHGRTGFFDFDVSVNGPEDLDLDYSGEYEWLDDRFVLTVQDQEGGEFTMEILIIDGGRALVPVIECVPQLVCGLLLER